MWISTNYECLKQSTVTLKSYETSDRRYFVINDVDWRVETEVHGMWDESGEKSGPGQETGHVDTIVWDDHWCAQGWVGGRKGNQDAVGGYYFCEVRDGEGEGK